MANDPVWNNSRKAGRGVVRTVLAGGFSAGRLVPSPLLGRGFADESGLTRMLTQF